MHPGSNLLPLLLKLFFSFLEKNALFVCWENVERKESGILNYFVFYAASVDRGCTSRKTVMYWESEIRFPFFHIFCVGKWSASFWSLEFQDMIWVLVRVGGSVYAFFILMICVFFWGTETLELLSLQIVLCLVAKKILFKKDLLWSSKSH